MNTEELQKLVKTSKIFINICIMCLSLLVIYRVANSYWYDPPSKAEPRFKNTLQRDINP